ncbi:MAG TPA: hypothetical protein VGK48_04550 [Terriglobia bacterium]|jgi:hypothetical protein
MRPALIVVALVLALVPVLAQAPGASYSDSIVIAPLYIEYAKVSDQKFAAEAQRLRRDLGQAPHVLLGFSAFLSLEYNAEPDLRQAIDKSILAPTLRETDLVVQRALKNGLITHVALTTGFFHGWNGLREAAIRQDVRNAQWFADGWIGRPAELTNPEVVPRSVWLTPSRYARELHSRMEESVRIVASHLAGVMEAAPATLVSVSGDGEVELSWERNLGEGAVGQNTTDVLYTDYSPFAVAEFRDSLRFPKYAGDHTPDTDDDHNGHTLNSDYRQHFTTWDLKYFNDSGPISFAAYVALSSKLPISAPYFKAGGFDAPRSANPGDPFWKAWIAFRRQMVSNYVRDFAQWVTTAASPSGFKIPSDRYYSHQIPADYLFEQPDNIRLRTSASPAESGFIAPFGGSGVTAYNIFDGKRHLRTATPLLFSQLAKRSRNWAVLEYNPSMPLQTGTPPSSDLDYYDRQLRLLYSYRPHVVVPFAWTELPDHIQESINGKPFERALARFIKEIGNMPWAPAGK